MLDAYERQSSFLAIIFYSFPGWLIMKFRFAFLLLLLSSITSLAAISSNGPTFGGEEITVDLPISRHVRNTSSRGLGNCVFTSIGMAADYQNVHALKNFAQWVISKGIPGGSYPDKTDRLIAQMCADRNLPIPEYIQHTGGDLEFLKLALNTGRYVSVTYNGRDDFYNGSIAHMVNLVHLSEKYAVIQDNNRPGVWTWMSVDEFVSRWRGSSGGWAVVLLGSPPPPVPINMVSENRSMKHLLLSSALLVAPIHSPGAWGTPVLSPVGEKVGESFEWVQDQAYPDYWYLYRGSKHIGTLHPGERGYRRVTESGGWSEKEDPPLALPTSAIAADKPKFVLHTMSGCAPCNQLKAHLKEAKVRDELLHWDFNEASGALSRKQGITSFPTLVVLGTDGKEIARHVGFERSFDLSAWLKQSRVKVKEVAIKPYCSCKDCQCESPCLCIAPSEAVVENFGIDLDKIHQTPSYSISGQHCSRERAFEAITAGQLTDDRAKAFLTIKGPKEFQDRVLNDLATKPELAFWKGKLHVNAYDSNDWHPERIGLADGVTFQLPPAPGSNRSAPVFRIRTAQYTPNLMFVSLRDKDPNYKNDNDPDPSKPAPSKPGEGFQFSFEKHGWIVAFGILILVLIFTRAKKVV